MIMSLPSFKVTVFLMCLCFNMVSIRGQESLGYARIGLLQGFSSKFPTSILVPLYLSPYVELGMVVKCFWPLFLLTKEGGIKLKEHT